MKLKLNQKKTALIFICITIIFIGIESYVLVNEKKHILSYAQETLKQAVNIDLERRWKKAGFGNQYMLEAHFKDSVIYPLQIHSHSKEREYLITIPKKKDLQNINPIQTEEKKRLMQSLLCHTIDSIQLDTLQFIWNTQLKDQGINMPTSLRLNYNLHTTRYTLVTNDTLQQQCYHPLKQYYLGSDFEYTLYSYIRTSIPILFIHSIPGYNLFIIIAYILVILLFIYIKSYLQKRKIHEANIKENIMKETKIKIQEEVQRKIEEEKQKRLALEKERMTNKVLHYFSDEIFYNKNTQILSIYGKEIKLRNQLAILFTLYIESENYEITSRKIKDNVWPDGSGNDEKRRRLLYSLRETLPTEFFKIQNKNQGNSKLYFIKEWDNAKFLISSK